MKKSILTYRLKESKDSNSIIKIKLKSIIDEANEILSQLDNFEEIEPWMQIKISEAEDNISSIYKQIKYGEESIEELPLIHVHDKSESEEIDNAPEFNDNDLEYRKFRNEDRWNEEELEDEEEEVEYDNEWDDEESEWDEENKFSEFGRAKRFRKEDWEDFGGYEDEEEIEEDEEGEESEYSDEDDDENKEWGEEEEEEEEMEEWGDGEEEEEMEEWEDDEDERY